MFYLCTVESKDLATIFGNPGMPGEAATCIALAKEIVQLKAEVAALKGMV